MEESFDFPVVLSAVNDSIPEFRSVSKGKGGHEDRVEDEDMDTGGW